LNNDQVSSGIWLFISLIICMASFKYKIGTLSAPGSGFLPLLSGAAMALFAAIGLVDATLRNRKGEKWHGFLKGLSWEKALIILASLFSYAWLLEFIGFSLCTLFFIGFLLRVIDPQRWSLVIGWSLSITAASYILFEVLLKAQMPKGPWGF
jgi:putative tricarboxylic transport membrane protein